MAEESAGSTREDRRQPAPFLRDTQVTDRVDTTMEWMQVAAQDESLDRLPTEPELEQLLSAHWSVSLSPNRSPLQIG